MLSIGGLIFFFYDSSFLKYREVFIPYCLDYYIEMRRGLGLLVIDDADWRTAWFYLFLEEFFFTLVGDLRLLIDGVLLRESCGNSARGCEYSSSV